jgi:PqqD family protein of HPr-rel-A system
LWRRWDDESVVFDTRSGDIHLLDPVAARALRYLEGTPATVDELTRTLDASLGLEGDPDLLRYVAKLVAELDELGLVEPATVDIQ